MNAAIRNFGAWLDEAGTTLAAHKMENMEVAVVGKRVESNRAIKYLRVISDDRLNFKELVKYIGEKASVHRVDWRR